MSVVLIVVGCIMFGVRLCWRGDGARRDRTRVALDEGDDDENA